MSRPSKTEQDFYFGWCVYMQTVPPDKWGTVFFTVALLNTTVLILPYRVGGDE